MNYSKFDNYGGEKNYSLLDGSEPIIQFMLALKKKQYMKNMNQILSELNDIKTNDDVELEVIRYIKKYFIHQSNIQRYKKTSSNNEKVDYENFDTCWKNVQKQFVKGEVQLWHNLHIDYENDQPKNGVIYKKLYTEIANELRYCNASCVIGFYNTSESEDLYLKWGNDKLSLETFVPKNKIRCVFDSFAPLFLNKAIYEDFRIKEKTHCNFYILYCWLPDTSDFKKIEFHFQHNKKTYRYNNGFLEMVDSTKDSKLIKILNEDFIPFLQEI